MSMEVRWPIGQRATVSVLKSAQIVFTWIYEYTSHVSFLLASFFFGGLLLLLLLLFGILLDSIQFSLCSHSLHCPRSLHFPFKDNNCCANINSFRLYLNFIAVATMHTDTSYNFSGFVSNKKLLFCLKLKSFVGFWELANKNTGSLLLHFYKNKNNIHI